MRILLTGGGTGGHITPILAVARELKKAHPNSHITYIGERHGKFAHITDDNHDIDEIRTIFAGKVRRYHGDTWLRRLFDIKTNLLNLRDLFYIFLGSIQSLFLVRSLKPDVVFLKGGFVGVPVGLAAILLKKPFITHDSDAMPGLANRLVSRWAKYHATGMPPEFYNYAPSSMRYVGVLVGEDYQVVDQAAQVKFKQALNISTESLVLLVTGGSHGAVRLNDSFKELVPKLLDDYNNLIIIHQVGRKNLKTYGEYTNDRLVISEFLMPMHYYTGAADVVVTRAGANTLAELGVQGKACIVVPNPQLTGGHQMKNAENLMRHGAVMSIDEREFKKSPEKLDRAIRSLLQDGQLRMVLGSKLHEISIPDAAKKLAELLLDVAHKK